MKSLLLRAAPLALCLAFGQPAFSQSVPPVAAEAPVELTAEQWREDLAFMVAEMKRRHPNLYHTVSREKFEAAVAGLDSRIPQLNRNQIIVGLMRIAALVGDGHTRVDPRKDPKFGFKSLPLKLYLFDDGLFVRAARPNQSQLVGAEVLEVGGVPVAEALRRVANISSRDNPMGAKLFAPLYLAMPDILQALGLSGSRTAATFRLRKGGRTWTATVPAGHVDPPWPDDTDISLMTPEGWVDALGTAQPPLWLQDPLDYHRLIELPARRALYAQLNMVTHEKDQTLAQFGRAIAERAKAVNPRTIVLDLRLNQGGGGHLRNPFVRELIRAEGDGTRLLVLTRRGTYSASQFILDDLDRLSQAHFIGEPASSKPSSFGDAYRTPLPNSGINLRTSILWWQAEQNFAPWNFMDVSVPLTFADYASGRDPVLEAAVDYQEPARLYDQLEQAKAAADVRKIIDAFVADPRNRYANLELQLLIGAEQLARANQFEPAMAAAETAAREFPNSHDAQYVHAWVAEQAGKPATAVDAVRRALAVDPNSRQARSLLERMQKATARPSPPATDL